MVVRKGALAVKLSEAVDYYLTTCKTEGLSPRTIEWYRQKLACPGRKSASSERTAGQDHCFSWVMVNEAGKR